MQTPIVTKPSYFDVPYAIPSVLLGVGTTVVSATGGDYLGLAIKATSAGATILVYDNASTGSGRLLDILTVAANVATTPERGFVLKAKNGFTVSLIGTGAQATIFYSPKG